MRAGSAAVSLCVAVLTAGGPGSADAATQMRRDSILVEAMRLATEGQGDSARAFVRSHLDTLQPSDSLYAEALYAAGVVADDGDEAESYFRRVSIEFSQSPWADDALLRLAQLAFAEGDYEGTIRAVDRLVMDYPFTRRVAEGRYWAGRALLERGDRDAACRHLELARQGAGEDVELAQRVRFYQLRCAQAAAESPPLTPAGGGEVWYSVQVAAFQNVEAADELMRALHAAGFSDVHATQEDGFLKVRVGRFARRADAAQVVPRIARQFGGSPFVVEVR